jgi:hypothetical protein
MRRSARFLAITLMTSAAAVGGAVPVRAAALQAVTVSLRV